MITKEEKDKRLRDSESLPRILAKDAEVGKEYLVTGMLFKVKIVSIGDNVSVLSEINSYNSITISAGTELVAYDSAFHISHPDSIKKKSTTKEKGTKMNKEKTTAKEPGAKMSSIITPGLLAGKTPEVIADEVIAAMPDRAPERKVLIRRIQGPRVTYLIDYLKKNGKPVPEHLLAMASKKKKKEEEVRVPEVVKVPEVTE